MLCFEYWVMCSAAFLVMPKSPTWRRKSVAPPFSHFASPWSRWFPERWSLEITHAAMELPSFTTRKWVDSVHLEWCVEIDGQYRFDKKGRHFYVPRALCVLSHQPMFSVFNAFLREVYRYSILDSEDRFADEKTPISRVHSFECLLRKGNWGVFELNCRFYVGYTSW